VARFHADRRSDAIAERVARDVRDGLRAGVAQTPTLVLDGVLHGGVPTVDLLGRLHETRRRSEQRERSKK
jgi:predicted DsbA family dithiol-disulfide isomerase